MSARFAFAFVGSDGHKFVIGRKKKTGTLEAFVSKNGNLSLQSPDAGARVIGVRHFPPMSDDFLDHSDPPHPDRTEDEGALLKRGDLKQ